MSTGGPDSPTGSCICAPAIQPPTNRNAKTPSLKKRAGPLFRGRGPKNSPASLSSPPGVGVTTRSVKNRPLSRQSGEISKWRGPACGEAAVYARTPHFVLAARRWGWPLSNLAASAAGRFALWDGSRMAETRSGSVRSTTVRPRDLRAGTPKPFMTEYCNHFSVFKSDGQMARLIP
jgi:hypothetical protein